MTERTVDTGKFAGLYAGVPVEMRRAIKVLQEKAASNEVSPEDIFVEASGDLALASKGNFFDQEEIMQAEIERHVALIRPEKATESPVVDWELSMLGNHSHFDPRT